MNNRILLISLLCAAQLTALPITAAHAKTDRGKTSSKTASPFAQRLFYGGNLGLTFSDAQTRISVAPLAGFRITPDWSAGLQLAFEYYTYDYLLNGQNATAKTYGFGGGLFTRYEAPIRFLQRAGSGIYAHTEYDYMRYSRRYNHNQPNTRNNRHSWWLGVGGYIPVSPRSRLSVTALWELWHSDSTPYSATPLIRVGIQF